MDRVVDPETPAPRLHDDWLTPAERRRRANNRHARRERRRRDIALAPPAPPPPPLPDPEGDGVPPNQVEPPDEPGDNASVASEGAEGVDDNDFPLPDDDELSLDDARDIPSTKDNYNSQWTHS